jgi:hypothetical protein
LYFSCVVISDIMALERFYLQGHTTLSQRTRLNSNATYINTTLRLKVVVSSGLSQLFWEEILSPRRKKKKKKKKKRKEKLKIKEAQQNNK